MNLQVARGESVAVVGESGVGKSTLLHLLGALDRADGGRVVVAGHDLFSLSSRALAAVRNRDIGFVFQFHHLLGDFDAVENVMMPMLIAGRGGQTARHRAVEILERVGLGERLNHKPAELSGGEQQRVAVARAVVTQPAVVFADEPTGNLDPASGTEVQDLLRDVQHEACCALVVATHSAQLASKMERTFRLSGGMLTETRSL